MMLTTTINKVETRPTENNCTFIRSVFARHALGLSVPNREANTEPKPFIKLAATPDKRDNSFLNGCFLGKNLGVASILVLKIQNGIITILRVTARQSQRMANKSGFYEHILIFMALLPLCLVVVGFHLQPSEISLLDLLLRWFLSRINLLLKKTSELFLFKEVGCLVVFSPPFVFCMSSVRYSMPNEINNLWLTGCAATDYYVRE